MHASSARNCSFLRIPVAVRVRFASFCVCCIVYFIAFSPYNIENGFCIGPRKLTAVTRTQTLKCDETLLRKGTKKKKRKKKRTIKQSCMSKMYVEDPSKASI